MSITAIVDTLTNRFVTAGHSPDDRYIVVTVERNPDDRTEKWNGAAIVAKTADEIALYDQGSADASTAVTISDRLDLRAVVACIAECLNISEADVQHRLLRHLRHVHRKAQGL